MYKVLNFNILDIPPRDKGYVWSGSFVGDSKILLQYVTKRSVLLKILNQLYLTVDFFKTFLRSTASLTKKKKNEM